MERARRNPQDSHAITTAGGRVTVHDVELWSEMPSGPLGAVGDAELAKCAHETNRRIAEGQYPQIVVEHESPDRPTSPEAVGRVSSPVRVVKHRTGRKVLVGDVSFSRDRFSELVETNRYPRRSAEIYRLKDGNLWLGQVALIGREKPRADIPDVHFNAESDAPARFESDTPIAFSEKSTMTPTELLAAIKSLNDQDRAIVAAAFTDEKPVEIDDAIAAKFTDLEVQLSALHARNTALETKNTTLEAALASEQSEREKSGIRATLQRFHEVEGLAINVDEELKFTMSLPGDKRTEYLERIKANAKRTTTGTSLINGGAVAGGIAGAQRTDGKATFTDADSRKVTNLASKMVTDSGGTLDVGEAVKKAAKELGFEAHYSA